jgi:hypothetical protein
MAPAGSRCNPDDFLTMQGDMIDWELAGCPRISPKQNFLRPPVNSVPMVIPTILAARCLRITILKNQLNQQGRQLEAAEMGEN